MRWKATIGIFSLSKPSSRRIPKFSFLRVSYGSFCASLSTLALWTGYHNSQMLLYNPCGHIRTIYKLHIVHRIISREITLPCWRTTCSLTHRFFLAKRLLWALCECLNFLMLFHLFVYLIKICLIIHFVHCSFGFISELILVELAYDLFLLVEQREILAWLQAFPQGKSMSPSFNAWNFCLLCFSAAP